jgi:hypothetical protein
VFAARYELNSHIVFRKRLVSKRLRPARKKEATARAGQENLEAAMNYIQSKFNVGAWRSGYIVLGIAEFGRGWR